MLPMILHIPHASRAIPEHAITGFLRTPDEMQVELDRLTDHYTDEMFPADLPNCQRVIFPVSRFLVDPERFADDQYEPMAARGMGVLYTLDTQGQPYRRPLTAPERKQLLERYYFPHHKRLDELTLSALQQAPAVLFIDCHSFPDPALPCDVDQSPDRPDICIGTDAYHTPALLRDMVVAGFQHAGFSVAVNAPYAGTLIPNIAYQQMPTVFGIMIEINRRLYVPPGHLSERNDERIERLKQTIRQVLIHARNRLADFAPEEF